MKKKINEDIFRGINPDDLMSGSDEIYEMDYSDGLSQNKADDGKYEYGIWFEIYTPAENSLIDMCQYLIEMFESHSGNVGTYSDMSVQYNTHPKTKDEQMTEYFRSNAQNRVFRENPSARFTGHLTFMFNRQNPRRFILRLLALIRDYMTDNFENKSTNLYIWTGDTIYKFNAFLWTIDSVIIYKDGGTYIWNQFGLDNKNSIGYKTVDLDRKKYQLVQYSGKFMVKYLTKTHMLVEKEFDGEFVGDTTDRLKKNYGCECIAGERTGRTKRDGKNRFIIDRNLDVVADFDYMFNSGTDYLMMVDKDYTDFVVWDSKSERFLDSDEIEISDCGVHIKNNGKTIYYNR